jgi:hypothetical protein
MLVERQKVVQDYLRNIRQLVEHIHAYELHYERSTEDMLNELRSGDIEETWEIADWLISYERYRAITADWPKVVTAELAR